MNFLKVLFFILLLSVVLFSLGQSQKPIVNPVVQEPAYHIALFPAQKQKLIQIINSSNEAKNAFNQLKSNADKALKQEPNPISTVDTSHLVNKDPKKQATLKSIKDMPKIYALGFAYAVMENTEYGNKAKAFILAWVKVNNNPSSDPINERLFEPLFMAYDLTRDLFTNQEISQVNTWLLAKADTLINGINPKGTSAINNHNSHLLNVVGMIGYVTGNKDKIAYAVNGYKKQIAQDLNPDGSSYDFHQRDALYYHVFTLQPLLNLARIAQINGTSLYDYESPEGSSVQKSIDFLLPYVTGEKEHQEWINSTAPFDKERAEAGEAEFQPGILFQPKQAYTVLELYYYFSSEVLPLILQLSGTQAKKYPDFLLVYIDGLG